MTRAPLLLLAASALFAQAPAPPAPFEIEETTIAQVQEAFKTGRLTCRALVEGYLKRIEAYDKNGPAINSIVVLNPDAAKDADLLDRRFAQSGLTGPLHCVPMIVKDNFETHGLQTTDGALAFSGYLPEKDAFLVKRIREAGAIVLAKSNMAEWAFSPYETVNSILPGYTKNPYALDRVTAGSSGGTAAAVAASLGLAGLGTDTGNSIAPGARRHPLHHGPHQPRRHLPPQPPRRYRRPHGAHRRGRRPHLPGGRRP
jgi:Asp-tRNA(Asn)/Glu-tRNA(Gln) amidotransferase A subunit family amidase